MFMSFLSAITKWILTDLHTLYNAILYRALNLLISPFIYHSFLDYIGRLFWISANRPPQSHSEAYFFNVDNELVYEPFNSDFGPLNLANTHKYVREMCRLLADERYKDVKLFHYASTKSDK